MRLLASFFFGLFAELATGLVIGAGMYFTTGRAMPANPADVPSWVPFVAILAGSIFTFVIARWRASRNADRAMAHALLVAAGAIGLHILSTFGDGQTVTIVHVMADVMKLVAGATAGEVVRRRSAAS